MKKVGNAIVVGLALFVFACALYGCATARAAKCRVDSPACRHAHVVCVGVGKRRHCIEVG